MAEILRSNKDPKKVCNIFVNYLTVTKGVPRKVALIVGPRMFLQQVLKDTSEGITRMMWLDIRAFYSETLEWWIYFSKRTSSEWCIQQHRVFTSRVLQVCIFSCVSKGSKGYQRQLEHPSYSAITLTYQ